MTTFRSVSLVLATFFVCGQAVAETAPSGAPAKSEATSNKRATHIAKATAMGADGYKHCCLPDATGQLTPVPDEALGPREKMYCAAIEAKAIQMETESVDSANLALAKAFQLGVYDDWILAAEEILAEFNPQLAAPVHKLPLVASDGFARSYLGTPRRLRSA